MKISNFWVIITGVSLSGEINATISIITNTSYPDKCIFQSIEEELVSEVESNLTLENTIYVLLGIYASQGMEG